MEFVKLETICGAPLYFCPIPHMASVATGIFVNVGGRDEKWPEEAGLSHAFEHMVFRGNAVFPTSKDLTAYIEKTGGACNAWTSREGTFFSTVLAADDFDMGVRYLYHLLSTPLFLKEHIKPELQLIIQELKQENDNLDQMTMGLFAKAVYGSHPLSRRLAGTIRSVGAFTRDRFFDYKGRFYHPGNFIFLVAGNISEEAALRSFDHYFAEAGRQRPNIRKPIPVVGRKKRMIVRKDVEQVHLCMGNLIGGACERSTKALNFFAMMIDGGMSFPLFQEVRDKRGLCYEINAELTAQSDHGLFEIYVATDQKRWRETVDVVNDVVLENAENKKLFEETKKFFVGRTKLSCESPIQVVRAACEDIFINGEPRSTQEKILEIESFELAEITEAVKRYLDPEHFVHAYVVPKDLRI